MHPGRVGVWLIGAWGGVATTVVVGLSALKRGLSDTTGLVSALPPFARLDLLGWNDIVIGGHEIRQCSYAQAARQLYSQSRVFSEAVLVGVADDLAAADANVRPGTVLNVGSLIEKFADPEFLTADFQVNQAETPQGVIDRLSQDLREFQQQHALDRVIVIQVSSTEPTPHDGLRTLDWSQLQAQLQVAGNASTQTSLPIPASTLYAIAAFEAGAAYINFTPSVGSDLPAVHELALERRLLHVGRDGKTGETLLKSVLAPMFAARNLHIMSWVGHNILGNMDGQALDDPSNKANKVRSKDHLLTEILGYKPQTLVSIEYIQSLGDWKTAWDHIHFRGFLDTPMTLQFTWQGCDSLLAGPLVIDLIRLTEREWRRGTSGTMPQLAAFFKSPMGEHHPDFAAQNQALLAWADQVAAES